MVSEVPIFANLSDTDVKVKVKKSPVKKEKLDTIRHEIPVKLSIELANMADYEAETNDVEESGNIEEMIKSGKIMDRYLLDAKTYADPEDGSMVEYLLTKPETLEACRLMGISQELLLPKDKSEFLKEPKRAKPVHDKVAELRYEAFENRRLKYIALVLQAKAHAKTKLKNDEAFKAMNHERMNQSLKQAVEMEASREQEAQRVKVKLKRYREQQERKERMVREQFNKQLKKQAQRDAKIQKMKELKGEEFKEKWNKKKENIQKAAELREQKQETLTLQVQLKHESIEHHMASDDATMNIIKANKKNIQFQHETHRAKVLHKFQKKKAQASEKLEKNRLESNLLAQELEEQRNLDVMLSMERKSLEALERRERVDRIRAAQEYQKQCNLEKSSCVNSRLAKENDVNQFVKMRRDLESRKDAATMDAWQADHLAKLKITPGPGEYEYKPPSVGGGKFGNDNPKSDIEWQIYRAAQIPGPGAYDVKMPDITGGAIPASVGGSDVEVQMRRALELPGPGRYDLPNPKIVSHTFDKDEQSGEIARLAHVKSLIPGPTDYDAYKDMGTGIDPIRLRQTYASTFSGK